jgi:hypothetical protein
MTKITPIFSPNNKKNARFDKQDELDTPKMPCQIVLWPVKYRVRKFTWTGCAVSGSIRRKAIHRNFLKKISQMMIFGSKM